MERVAPVVDATIRALGKKSFVVDPIAVEETAPCFIVRDANGQALAFVYCEDEPGRRATAKLLTRDQGPAHRRQHRQAAGAAAQALSRSPVLL